jgi:hypothetical protein
MKQTEEVVRVVIGTLEAIFKSDYSDVAEVFKYSHYIESIQITLINAKRLGFHGHDYAGCTDVLSRMVNLRLLSEEIFSFWVTHGKIIRDLLDMHWNSGHGDPQAIHEEMLSRELNISGNEVWYSPGKSVRDTMGSYYTPGDLAIEVVHEAVERFLCNNDANTKSEAVRLLTCATFVDLACGCGEFIRAAQIYLNEQYGIKPEEVCGNFYGIDINPIALQITICDLLEISDSRKWNEIISHFTLGNPLIHQPNEKCMATKTRLFSMRRYYAPDMGLDLGRIFRNTSLNVILGNPPWEKVRFEERNFFKSFKPEISNITKKNIRHNAIMKLEEQSPICFRWYCDVADDYARFKSEAAKHPCINISLSGELNTYALFAELSLSLLDDVGVSTIVVKSALVTTPANRPFFNQIIENGNLSALYLYDNTLKIFRIDSREKFCVISCTKKKHRSFEVIAGVRRIGDMHALDRTRVSAEDIKTINPITLMMPNISGNDDMKALLDIHRRLPIFKNVYPECHFGRLVHLTTHAHQIKTKPDPECIPIYEGKFIERYDARYATYAGLSDAKKYSAKAQARRIPIENGRKEMPESRFFIRKDFWKKISKSYSEPYMLCWRSLTSATNARTTLSMLLPSMPTCQSIQFLQTENTHDLLILLALFNSKPFDYLVRLKMPGIDLTQSTIRQIPVPHRDAYQECIQFDGIYQSVEKHILQRVSALILAEPMVSPVLQTTPSERIRCKSKSVLESELDVLLSMAYGLSDLEKLTMYASFKAFET